jgi:REP element-mobilizing transposase RayT
VTDRIESAHGEGLHGSRDAASAPPRRGIDPGRKGRVRPRLPDFDYTGRYAYHFELNTNHRRPVLAAAVADAIISDLTRAADATWFELLAFTVMPDHVHILALGARDEANALSFMQRFKQLTGYRFAKTYPKPFWQQSFFDHVVRLEEDLLPIARYILGNATAAGFLPAGEVWPYSGGTLLATLDSHPGGDGAEAASLRPRNDDVRPGSREEAP